MTEDKAREILLDFGIETDDTIGTLSDNSLIRWPYWETPDEAYICGVVTADVLEALAWWMRHKLSKYGWTMKPGL